MAHGEHQVHLLPFGKVQAHLKVRFPHAPQEIGPVRQVGGCLEVEGNHFLELGQQLPGTLHGRGAGHLKGRSNTAAKAGQSRKSLQLQAERPGAEGKNSHRLAAGRGAS